MTFVNVTDARATPEFNAEDARAAAKKFRLELERQVKEELKSDNENPVPSATLTAVRQKFGLAALPPVKDIAQNLKGCKR